MRRRDRIAAACVALTVVVSALALGGSTRWTAVAAASLGLACGAVYLPSRRQMRRIPWLLWLLAAAVVATALQLVPLPLALLGEKGELLVANAAAFGALPGAAPLSYDPPATWLELAKLAGYLGFAACAIRLGGRRRGRRAIAVAVAVAGTALAAAAALHALAGLERVYGLYTPRHASAPVLLAPLLNPNHLAGCLAACAPVAAALAFASSGARRLGWAAAAALCVAVALAASSRMGVLSLLLGAGVLAALLAPRASVRRPGSDRVAIGAIAVVAAVSALWIFGSDAIEEILGTGADEMVGERGKLAAWRAAIPLVFDHPILGVGRGGFEAAFSGRLEGAMAYSHVENEYLQALLDWGLVPAALFAALLALAVREAAPRAGGSAIEAGLAASLVAAGFHNLADFALELPGVAYLSLAAFAGLSRTELRSAAGRRSRLARRAALLAAGAAAVGLAASPVATSARDETDALARWAKDRQPAAVLERASTIWRRHPRDFVAAAQVAEALYAAGDPRAVKVMNRALAIKPDDGGLHWLAARMLVSSQRPEQALVEYRLALAHARDRAPILRELLARFPEPERALRALPLDRWRGAQLAHMIRGLRRPELGLLFTTALAERHPEVARFHRERASFALATGELEAAIAAGRAALSRGDSPAVVTLARALLASDRAADAAAAIEEVRAAGQPRARRQILVELDLLARARQEQGELREALDALGQAVEIAGLTPEAAPRLRRMAAILDQLELSDRARQLREQAEALSR